MSDFVIGIVYEHTAMPIAISPCYSPCDGDVQVMELLSDSELQSCSVKTCMKRAKSYSNDDLSSTEPGTITPDTASAMGCSNDDDISSTELAESPLMENAFEPIGDVQNPIGRLNDDDLFDAEGEPPLSPSPAFPDSRELSPDIARAQAKKRG